MTYSESRGASSPSRYQRSQFSDIYLQHDIRMWRVRSWRRCSGGKDLPLGKVSAAAEMLVTFN
ncbi:hypothetical protein [Serratia fonticola]|uniref:hypothetical protein n=1 Tax=Serratia fonticola TaxID=47917 RepID=UPI001FCE6D9E|nr:hypothetical protein [Serratia fonticola]